MLTRWSDFDRTLAWMDQFRAQMDSLFEEYDGGFRPSTTGSWPRTNLYDNGNELVIRAEVPGLSDKDIDVTVNQDVLTIRGERKHDAPEGYTTHRQERGAYRFARSYAFPTKVDMEKVAAEVKNGVLTVRLAKAPEAQPRQISVKAG